MTKLPIPDLRFQSAFMSSLAAENSKVYANSDSNSNSTQRPISLYVVAKVVVRDILFMPLVQGTVYAMVLLLARPWLAAVAHSGREFGVRLFHSLGLRPSTPQRRL